MMMTENKEKGQGIDEPSENWTKFPNCILDNLERFTPVETKIICLMVRKNLGYKDPNKQFSSGYVAKKLDISKSSAKIGLDGLEKKGSIKTVGTESRGVKLYDIRWRAPLGQNITQSEYDPELGQNTTPVLENKVQENREEPDATAWAPRLNLKGSRDKAKAKDYSSIEPFLDLIKSIDKKYHPTKEVKDCMLALFKKHGSEAMDEAIRGRALIKGPKEKGWRYLFSVARDWNDALDANASEKRKLLDMQNRFNPERTALTAEDFAAIERSMAI